MNNKNKNNLNDWKKSDSKAEHLWALSEGYKSSYKPDLEKGMARFRTQIKDAEAETQIIPIASSRRSWLRIAAAIVFVLGFSFVWKNFMQDTASVGIAQAGETTALFLEDGTKVILNQNSRLEYPASFEGAKTRLVRLIGEAHFEVAHNPAQPFTIETPASKVTVLGTSFNLRAYPNENFTEVEVETGKVEFISQSNKDKIYLIANEKGTLKDGKKLVKKVVLNLNAQVWQTQKLVLKKSDFSTAANLLERRFNVQIELAPKVKDYQITMNIDKDSKIEDVFALMERTHDVKINKKANGTFVIK